MSTFDLFPRPSRSPPSSFKSHLKFDTREHNESDILLFSANHTKFIEYRKNLELRSTSHAKINKFTMIMGKGLWSMRYVIKNF